MEHLADEFIRRRRSMVVGRGRRYPESMRQLAVDSATEAVSLGWSDNRIAQHLGVTWATLERWSALHPAVQPSAMCEVVVSDESRSSVESHPVLVTPEGYRIEGLQQEDLIEFLRALRQ